MNGYRQGHRPEAELYCASMWLRESGAPPRNIEHPRCIWLSMILSLRDSRQHYRVSRVGRAADHRKRDTGLIGGRCHPAESPQKERAAGEGPISKRLADLLVSVKIAVYDLMSILYSRGFEWYIERYRFPCTGLNRRHPGDNHTQS